MKLDIAEDVASALARGLPVVALETTVITHGMSFPDNLQIARGMEDAVRSEGACPATIGIVEGRIVVGMNSDQLAAFARAQKDRVIKCSPRDLAAVIAAGKDGSLTVAGTLTIAAAAGIPILTTGGIGGVHRGRPQDVSADLYELGRRPLACVCSGAKSILDLPATLEVLESLGVTVLGLGTSNLPAFFAVDSGIPLAHSVATPDAAADVLRAWKDLDATSGLLITVPVPERCGLSSAEADEAVLQAVRCADEKGVSGGRLTPFLLQRIAEITHGRSLTANKALLVNNAGIAARLARTANLGKPRL